jgi:hypothetical protein
MSIAVSQSVKNTIHTLILVIGVAVLQWVESLVPSLKVPEEVKAMVNVGIVYLIKILSPVGSSKTGTAA